MLSTTKTQTVNFPDLESKEGKAFLYLMKETLYPGLPDQPVATVFQCCKRFDIDPMLKPYHIVKMGKDSHVVMPGIGLYRILATRSGTYLGLKPPKFGPMVTKEFKRAKKKEVVKSGKFGDYKTFETTGEFETVLFTYPEWCELTCRKKVEQHIVSCSYTSFWLESYVKESKDSEYPNEMWAKRPNSQLIKCTEAGLLKSNWPELVPQQPSFEEMQGREYIDLSSEEYSEVQVVPTLIPVSTMESLKLKLGKPEVKNDPELIQENKEKVAETKTASILKENGTISDEDVKKHETRTKIDLYKTCGSAEVLELINEFIKKCNINSTSEFTDAQAKRAVDILESGFTKEQLGVN